MVKRSSSSSKPVGWSLRAKIIGVLSALLVVAGIVVGILAGVGVITKTTVGKQSRLHVRNNVDRLKRSIIPTQKVDVVSKVSGNDDEKQVIFKAVTQSVETGTGVDTTEETNNRQSAYVPDVLRVVCVDGEDDDLCQDLCQLRLQAGVQVVNMMGGKHAGGPADEFIAAVAALEHCIEHAPPPASMQGNAAYLIIRPGARLGITTETFSSIIDSAGKLVPQWDVLQLCTQPTEWRVAAEEDHPSVASVRARCMGAFPGAGSARWMRVMRSLGLGTCLVKAAYASKLVHAAGDGYMDDDTADLTRSVMQESDRWVTLSVPIVTDMGVHSTFSRSLRAYTDAAGVVHPIQLTNEDNE